jgi:hypothetical protein
MRQACEIVQWAFFEARQGRRPVTSRGEGTPGRLHVLRRPLAHINRAKMKSLSLTTMASVLAMAAGRNSLSRTPPMGWVSRR